jgi:hypothetical protein
MQRSQGNGRFFGNGCTLPTGLHFFQLMNVSVFSYVATSLSKSAFAQEPVNVAVEQLKTACIF